MIKRSVPSIQKPGFTAVATQTGTSVGLRLTGNADMAIIDELGKFLVGLHVAALNQKVTDVQIDLRELYFMNSSCLRHLVTWLSSVNELPQAQQYRLVFMSNANLRWQARSLQALKHFAEGLVVIL